MRRVNASALIALAIAASAGGPKPLTPLGVQPASQSDKQAPATVQAQSADLQFLADAGSPLFRRGASGIPWPGKPAAWARRAAGAWTAR